MSLELPKTPVRLLLVADQALFRESVASYLASQPRIYVAAFDSPASAFADPTGLDADILLLDLDSGLIPGGDIVALWREKGFAGRIVALLGQADPRLAAWALKGGASGVFLKSAGADRLVIAVILVSMGMVWVDQRLIRLLADQFQLSPKPACGFAKRLSDRERDVLGGILSGLTNRKIGDRIGVSEGAVKAVVQQLFSKAGVRNRSQLVRAAIAGSMVDAEPLQDGPVLLQGDANKLAPSPHARLCEKLL